ncbi:hypothetical protein KAM472_38800 [Aeromonas caviae]|jgi:hypothetical protein|uniref:Uncharacterized protein n=1 Tax=Aeromonas caviae TaxID=648 RepID=A0AA37D0T0_AERCA|nr:hypothetical protein KAM333_37190 [Aeromonas caviae]GJA11710.1 hypothetical protein KAM334_30210 [Aeromonas caviae]GJA16549.1 hypothetical protein KAM335_37450 [Aeromonas caviae]GJA18867.1 hypothetical protein KAM336_18880 [Aeromonas caviae]GJA25388.1 hypothetical protein KAM337_39160 [Aeromonas caviae]
MGAIKINIHIVIKAGNKISSISPLREEDVALRALHNPYRKFPIADEDTNTPRALLSNPLSLSKIGS